MNHEPRYAYIQSRYYRAPEVVLEINYGFEIDLWSLGCVLYESFEGRPLFVCTSELQLIRMMYEALGAPNASFLVNSPRFGEYFDATGQPNWSQQQDDHGPKSAANLKKRGIKLRNKDIDVHNTRSLNFFIHKLLKWQPEDRFTCSDLLKFEYFK